MATGGEIRWPPAGRNDGHQWGIKWPPVGRNRWPLTQPAPLSFTPSLRGPVGRFHAIPLATHLRLPFPHKRRERASLPSVSKT
jgi:hypothetical protein